MRLTKFLTAACGLAIAISAVPANAAIYSATFSGTVKFGTDASGLFGSANSDLAGANYVANYLFDTRKGNAFTNSNYTAVSGGSAIGPTSPTITSSLIINGHTVIFNGDSSSTYYQAISSGGQFGAQSQARDLVGDTVLINELVLSTGGPFGPTGLEFVEFDGALDGNFGGGHFSYRYYSSADALAADGEFQAPTHLTIKEIAAVPEPATWTLMLAGFGMIGFAARRRSAFKTTVTYA